MKKLVNTEEFINSRQGRRLFRLVQPLADRLLGFHGINKIYYQTRAKEPTSSGEFCQGVLEVLDTEVKVDPAFIEVFNTEAPLIIVANHPYGCIDAMALIKVIDQHARSPWKVLANQLLRNIEELSENTISVFPSLDGKGGAKTANVKPLKEMQLCLKAGGILVMFPAGRVSGRHPEHGVVLFFHTSQGITLSLFFLYPRRKRLRELLRLRKK